MHFDKNYKFTVVIDPTPNSELCDCLFQASLCDLELQFRGGLKTAENPTLYTNEQDAHSDVSGRFAALHAAQAIAKNAGGIALEGAAAVQIVDRDGKVLLKADLG